MKQMEYDDSGVTRILHVEDCNGEQIVVLNVRGTHPCAYVSMSLSDELAEKILKLDCSYYYFGTSNDSYVHGGFTYGEFGKPFKDDKIRDSFWLGWDYAHLGDYYAGGLPCSSYEKQWTTEEIVEEARSIAGHVEFYDD